MQANVKTKQHIQVIFDLFPFEFLRTVHKSVSNRGDGKECARDSAVKIIKEKENETQLRVRTETSNQRGYFPETYVVWTPRHKSLAGNEAATSQAFLPEGTKHATMLEDIPEYCYGEVESIDTCVSPQLGWTR